jgi:hypothetical protein
MTAGAINGIWDVFKDKIEVNFVFLIAKLKSAPR